MTALTGPVKHAKRSRSRPLRSRGSSDIPNMSDDGVGPSSSMLTRRVKPAKTPRPQAAPADGGTPDLPHSLAHVSEAARREFATLKRQLKAERQRRVAAEDRAVLAERRLSEAGLDHELSVLSRRIDSIERRLARQGFDLAEREAPLPAVRKEIDHRHGWKAIAAHLGVKPEAARHLARTAGLPVFKLGKTVAASVKSIDAWLGKGRNAATAAGTKEARDGDRS